MPTWSNIQSTFSDKMDFHAAMETFAEAWVAANTPTAVNSTEPQPQVGKQNSDDLPTLLTKEQLASKQSPPPSSSPSSPVSPVQLSPPSHAHTTKGHSHTPTGHTAIGQPPVGHTHSTTGHTSPTTGHSHPTTGHTQQTTGHTHSTTGLTHPTAGYNHPTSQSHSTGGHTHKKPDPIPVTGHTPQTPNPAPVSSVTPAGTKSLPVHCIIEQTTGVVTFDTPECGSNSSVELDSYAILPSTTLFGEVVRTALIKLGYNPSEAISAKGAVQIKNWRPLTFEVITDDEKATLEDIWGELTQVATLRIRLSSSSGFTVPDTWTDHSVRCAVLSLLRESSQSALAKECPLTQSTISYIANWKYESKLSAEKCREFGDWYKIKIQHVRGFSEDKSSPRDTRMTFHPEHEVPQMRKWYKQCKNPTNAKLKNFADELNKGHVRLERPKVTAAKVKIWWKNERQREKRISQKKLETNEEDDETSQESVQHSSDIEKTRSLLSCDLDKSRSMLLWQLDKSSSLLGFETSGNVSHLMDSPGASQTSGGDSSVSVSHTTAMDVDSHTEGNVSVSHDVASHSKAMERVHLRLQREDLRQGSHDSSLSQDVPRSHDISELSQSHDISELSQSHDMSQDLTKDTGWSQEG
ncbi:DNA-binding protein SATB2 [Mizuhopecten yessoensis]|uniref:DNA-binding protein SATB2 n=1 Tax=Mizuhopecten yessoensis TaxID=6573 RepID=A0A210Q7G1_MIZYE|nr:DNA-binding protein SATB2 [Mizuhopecten yessoensis]